MANELIERRRSANAAMKGTLFDLQDHAEKLNDSKIGWRWGVVGKEPNRYVDRID